MDLQIEANEEIARLTIDAERLKYSKQIQEQKYPEENVQNQVETQINKFQNQKRIRKQLNGQKK